MPCYCATLCYVMQFNVALMEVPCAMCTRAGVYLITVEPLLRDTSIIRTPLYYGQFTWSLRDRNPYKDYFSKMDTSVIRTLFSVLLMSVIKRFDCIQILRIYQLHAANPGPSITKRPRPTSFGWGRLPDQLNGLTSHLAGRLG